jgi:hypothetical protein
MQCPRCSSENDDASKFCWSCGTTLHKMPVPQTKVACPFCKHENASNANFCVACGKNLWRQSTGAAPIAAAVPDKAAGEPVVAATAAPSANFDLPRTPRKPIPPQALADEYNGAIKPEPRKSRFELAAGLVVLIAVLGSALIWWNHQKETRMAEIALSSVVPSASKPAGNPKPVVSATRQNYSTALPAPPTPPGSSSRDTEVMAETATAPVVTDKLAQPENPPVKRNTAKRTQTKTTHAPSSIGLSQEELRAEPVVQQPVRLPEPKPPTTREKVAACKQLSLFQKESCMWGICSGKWGKDGCPSYDR